MSAVSPSKEVGGTTSAVYAFSARILFAGEANEGEAYIASVWQDNTPEVFPAAPVGPDSDLRFIQFSDSAETAGDLDTITVNSGSDPRYMPTAVY
jgi:hypothetical protein